MLIKVYNDKYSIKSDPYNYIVYETRVNDKNEEVDFNHRYFPTVGHALEYIARAEARASEATSLEEYITDLKNIAEYMKNTLESLHSIVSTDKMLKKLLECDFDNITKEFEEIGEEKPKAKKKTKKK